jgi:hypothetical protein
MTDPRTESSRAAATGTPATHGHGHGVRSEDDRVPSISIVAVGIGALVIFFLASLATLSFLHMKEGDRPLLPVPQEIGQSKIGLVEQQLFETATRGREDLEARKGRLRSYGWVDRKNGIVRMPIDRAMELSAQGVRPRAGSPGAGAGTTEVQP